MKKALLAGLATVLFFLTSTGIAMAGDDTKNKTDSNNSKTTGLYDNVTILQEQINSLTERIGRIETLHEISEPIRRIDLEGQKNFRDLGETFMN
jgi:peptidoglycan hydrolase CwlO-like protein